MGLRPDLGRSQRTSVLLLVVTLGLLCSASEQPCEPSPCRSDQTCVPLASEALVSRLQQDYLCLCASDHTSDNASIYTGAACDQLLDPCLLASCVDCSGMAGTRNYTCACPPGWGGEDCTTQQNTSRCSGNRGDECEEIVKERSCASNPCRNGAICLDGEASYKCFCVPGFQGSHCELDINECASAPCLNDGTCLDMVDHYRCECSLGFKGVNCKVEIDECEDQPCLNGATCRDHVGRYSCDCLAGFQGHDCQLNIDECESAPCLNEGVCIDRVNSFQCDCEWTGFTGTLCEIDIPECASNPCHNGAECQEGVRQYHCLCYPGYEGELCQVDVNECLPEPCHHGGECYQRSEPANYQRLAPLQGEEFSYADAAGFICRCLPGYTGENCSVDVDECVSAPCQNAGSCLDLVNAYQCVCQGGFTGVHCEVDVNECESAPCQNGATCQDGTNSYACHCPAPQPGHEPWGGLDCDVPLVGCRLHRCQHGAVCKPTLEASGRHAYTCLCPSGWAGNICNTSTSFSFDTAASYVHIQLPSNDGRASAVADPGAERGAQRLQLRFRTTLPSMVLFYRGNGVRSVTLELLDGRLQAAVRSGTALQVVHPLALNDGEWHEASVTVDGSLRLVVRGPGCETEEGCAVEQGALNDLLFLQPGSFQQLYVGGGLEEHLGDTASGRGFVGCMDDLRVDGRLLMPEDLSREDNRGLAPGCNKRDWCPKDACTRHGTCVDMWVRASCDCHRPYYGDSCEKEFSSWTFGSEQMTSHASFIIGESHGDNFTISFMVRSLKPSGLLLQLRRDDHPYLTVYLKDGAVAIYSPHTTLLSEAGFVADGLRRQVSVEVRYGNVVFPKAGNHRALGNVSVQAGDVGYLGGLPTGDEDSASSWGGHLKGCLQDVRLDHKRLDMGSGPMHPSDEVYPIDVEQDVLKGCHSDETCKSEPCLNGGQCKVTWNDFLCSCPENFSGRLCETRLWCVEKPCPTGGRCVDLPDGYECLSEASFQDNALLYSANHSLANPVTSIKVSLRTRDRNAVVLRARHHAEVFCLAVLNSYLLVKLHSPASPQLLAFTSEATVSDGAWHHVHLTMADPDRPASAWYLSVDGERDGDWASGHRVGGNLNFLNHSEVRLAENFTGCLGEVRIGGVYLPLLGGSDGPQAARFSRRAGGHEPAEGCRGDPVCESRPCLHQGVCHDQFNRFNCSCSPGWEGELCERETDECSSMPCVYGTCEDLLADYRCQCDPGYVGKDCREEVDDCLEFSCQNGGLCQGPSRTCSCPAGFVGKRCQWRFPPVACDANTDCLNGGICMGGVLGGNCTCKLGYIGPRCEAELDECQSDPCQNGATCLDRLNQFQCVCVPGYSGRLCESNKLELSEHVPWLVVAVPLTSLCVLLAILAAFFLVLTARKKRQSEGTYSPSTQEVAGARLEMGSVLKVPPEERLI